MSHIKRLLITGLAPLVKVKLNDFQKSLAYSSAIGEYRNIINNRGFGGNVIKHFISYLLFLLMLMGCTPSRYQLTVDEYEAAAPRVRLGMSKEEKLPGDLFLALY